MSAELEQAIDQLVEQPEVDPGQVDIPQLGRHPEPGDEDVRVRVTENIYYSHMGYKIHRGEPFTDEAFFLYCPKGMEGTYKASSTQFVPDDPSQLTDLADEYYIQPDYVVVI